MEIPLSEGIDRTMFEKFPWPCERYCEKRLIILSRRPGGAGLFGSALAVRVVRRFLAIARSLSRKNFDVVRVRIELNGRWATIYDGWFVQRDEGCDLE